jgi:hypothetical protein
VDHKCALTGWRLTAVGRDLAVTREAGARAVMSVPKNVSWVELEGWSDGVYEVRCTPTPPNAANDTSYTGFWDGTDLAIPDLTLWYAELDPTVKYTVELVHRANTTALRRMNSEEYIPKPGTKTSTLALGVGLGVGLVSFVAGRADGSPWSSWVWWRPGGGAGGGRDSGFRPGRLSLACRSRKLGRRVAVQRRTKSPRRRPRERRRPTTASCALTSGRCLPSPSAAICACVPGAAGASWRGRRGVLCATPRSPGSPCVSTSLRRTSSARPPEFRVLSTL